MHSKYHRNLNREKEEFKGNLGVAVRSRQRNSGRVGKKKPADMGRKGRWEVRRKQSFLQCLCSYNYKDCHFA